MGLRKNGMSATADCARPGVGDNINFRHLNCYIHSTDSNGLVHEKIMVVAVHGEVVDSHTRCLHYQTALDIIAIKCKCCHKFYCCYKCHLYDTGTMPRIWGAADVNEPAILCGLCMEELSIAQYIQSGSRCPMCQAAFNPKCSLHYGLYFEPACVQAAHG